MFSTASNGFLLSLSLCLDIGIVNIAILTLAMQRGYWSGVWLGFGSCIGDLTYAILALVGMSSLLQFEAVRWVMWILGTIVMLYLAAKMLWLAIKPGETLPRGEKVDATDHRKQFFKGIALALSSPSAIIWFAVVGGALIARSGHQDLTHQAIFLGGFVLAGMVWTMGLAAVAHKGGEIMGPKLLQIFHVLSAILFAWFAWQVSTDGYVQLILKQAVR
ncbi:LysE family translocator [Leeia sp. TBRC 13508]|uniref:LysE family translocator n=1 Tax=Leeia speluncae TaxID=2884804 RepID=A0ABS8D3U7_9NEIS|nr:LysE family transporter [Leeia speluncae]MCB6182875.1 LysE family translocator [Leeia speluncae]